MTNDPQPLQLQLLPLQLTPVPLPMKSHQLRTPVWGARVRSATIYIKKILLVSHNFLRETSGVSLKLGNSAHLLFFFSNAPTLLTLQETPLITIEDEAMQSGTCTKLLFVAVSFEAANAEIVQRLLKQKESAEDLTCRVAT